MRSLLAVPGVYRQFVRAAGSKRVRTILVSDYIKPRDGNKILDIGCGEAGILDFLPSVEYIGFDTSPAYIEDARRRHGSRGRFHCGTVGKDTVDEPGTFDLVLAIGVLHHLTDSESRDLLDLAAGALKRGGRLVTFDGCFTPSQSLLARLILKADRGKFVRTPDAYQFLAQQVFTIVNCAVREDLLAIPYTHFVMECVKT